MKNLEDKIISEGVVSLGGILKVDTFINQMIDTSVLEYVGEEIARRFADEGITKVLTLESSGIAFACETARRLKVPAVFARKYEYVTLDDSIYQSRFFSYTRRKEMVIRVGKQLINENDRVLIIDDFIANGSAAIGLIDILKQSKAKNMGVCVLIEKGFLPGRQKIEATGTRFEALVCIESMDSEEIVFKK